MNGSYNTNNFIVRLRGLPWNTDRTEIDNFLQGLPFEFDPNIEMKISFSRL